jgi:predicted flavoprotein YhiN
MLPMPVLNLMSWWNIISWREKRGLSINFHDTIEWFENMAWTKTEDDGRMFPVSNSSQTIIECFLNATQKLELKSWQDKAYSLYSREIWKIETQNENYLVEKLILATGSNPKIWEMMQTYGHAIVSPVPSFTFNIKDPRIKELPGVAAHVTVKKTPN